MGRNSDLARVLFPDRLTNSLEHLTTKHSRGWHTEKAFAAWALPVTLATSTGKVVTVNSLASTREIDAGVGNTYAGNAGDADAGNAGFGQRG